MCVISQESTYVRDYCAVHLENGVDILHIEYHTLVSGPPGDIIELFVFAPDGSEIWCLTHEDISVIMVLIPVRTYNIGVIVDHV